jgi:hypothetical protein
MVNAQIDRNSDSYFGFGLGLESEITEQFVLSTGYAKDFKDGVDHQ